MKKKLWLVVEWSAVAYCAWLGGSAIMGYERQAASPNTGRFKVEYFTQYEWRPTGQPMTVVQEQVLRDMETGERYFWRSVGGQAGMSPMR